MKCGNCPALKTEGYEYPETYCGAGVPDKKIVEFQDGEPGCRYSAKRIMRKMERVERQRDNMKDLYEEDPDYDTGRRKEEHGSAVTAAEELPFPV